MDGAAPSVTTVSMGAKLLNRMSTTELAEYLSP
jgi:hypothetical protein